jgi:hypothetical protein
MNADFSRSHVTAIPGKSGICMYIEGLRANENFLRCHLLCIKPFSLAVLYNFTKYVISSLVSS